MQNKNTYKIKANLPHDIQLYKNHFPEGKFVWENCEFYINQDIEDCDFWIIFNTVDSIESANCSKNNTILITGEPDAVKTYHEKYIQQFATVISPQKLNHPNLINMQLLPWYVNKSYDFIKENNPKKSKLISCIISNKSFTDGHSKRLKFAEELKKHFGNSIDIYGKGINEIDEKWDAIEPYKYHIVLENSSQKYYFTEKILDACLGLSYPFYWGCANIADYFDSKSMSIIDIENPKEAIKIIKMSIEEDQFNRNFEYLQDSKNKVLNEYNMFAWVADYINKTANQPFEKENITIKSEWHYTKWDLMFKSFKKRPFKYPLELLKEHFLKLKV